MKLSVRCSALSLAFGFFSAMASDAQQVLTQYYPVNTRSDTSAIQLAYKGVLGLVASNTGGTYANAFSSDLYSGPSPNLRLNYVSLVSEALDGNFGTCSVLELPTFPNRLLAGLVVPRYTIWADIPSCWDSGTRPPSRGSWEFNDTFAFNTPVRRKTFDGAEFDASPLVQKRNGEPWLTTYWGFRLGLVESKLEWNEARLNTLPAFSGWLRYAKTDEEFMLVTLPRPVIDGESVEYINTVSFPNAPGGVYFYASNDGERALLDAQKPAWERTGKTFKHGGYVQVCRFYGSASPGPNSHFYTGNDKECELLKSIEVKPRPLDKQQLNFEGIAFYANMPIPPKVVGQSPTCPLQSIPLYRAYNASYGPNGPRNYDGNHRFTTSRADIDEVVAKGWIDEGIQMCVPQ
jgi:hypothetical protein